MTKKPHRRIRMVAEIEADTWEDLYGHLRNLVTEMACSDYRLSTSSVSGGYNSGHVISVSEDETMDHAQWAVELDEYLATLE